MTRPLAPHEAALELQVAATAAARMLPRRCRRERARLETITNTITHLVMTGRAATGAPRDVALAHFRQAMAAALAAGVGRDELVYAFNGDDDK